MADEYDSRKLKWKCTYGNCSKRFETEKEMKRHKVDAPEHDYCKKCNLDCADWEEFVRHKVDAMWPWLTGQMKDNKDETAAHIVCEFCGMDFKSFGGRKRHRDQAHKADQNIVCHGCKTIFTRAGNYVEHLESGRCEQINPFTGITRKEFNENMQHKHIVKEIMRNPGKFCDGFHDQAPALPSDLASENDAAAETKGLEEGGVKVILDQDDEYQKQGHLPLDPEVQLIIPNDQPYKLQDGSRSNTETWPRLPGLPSPSITESMRSISIGSPVPSISASDMSVSEYASIITSRRGGIKVLSETEASSPVPAPSDVDFDDAASEATTTAADAQKHTTVWNTGNTSQVLLKDAKATPAPGDYAAWSEHEQTKHNNPLRARFWDRTSSDYAVPRCFDPIQQKYACPMPDCDDAYDDIADLEGHLINTHVRRNYRCPLCLKIFKTAHALVSHSESGGKCKVKDTTYYDNLLDEISGGFLQAEQLRQPKVYKTSTTAVGKKGHVADGVMSTKFEATFPDEH